MNKLVRAHTHTHTLTHTLAHTCISDLDESKAKNIYAYKIQLNLLWTHAQIYLQIGDSRRRISNEKSKKKLYGNWNGRSNRFEVLN